MMFGMCLRSPNLSSLNISWGDVLEFGLVRRNLLAEKLDDLKSREAAQYK